MTMTCLETDAFLPQYLAGELSISEAEELRQHLSICHDCAHRAAGMREARLAIGRCVANAAQPDAHDVPHALIHAILTMAGSAPDWQQY